MWEEGAGCKGSGFCHINMLGMLLNFLLGRVKFRSCSACSRAKEEQGGRRREGLFLCRVSLRYPTKNPANVIQLCLQTSGAGTDCRHHCPRESHLQAELEMRARESIMNFLCSHKQELSLISFSGCSAPLSYINHCQGRMEWDLGHTVEEELQGLENTSRDTDWGAH